MIALHDYQSACLHRVRVALRQHRAVLLCAPTGSGKTAMATVMTGNAAAKQLRVAFLCHRDFLVEQTSATFEAHGIFHSFIAAGRRYNPFAPVYIASVSTLANRIADMPEPDLVICDECHHLPARTWSQIAAAWKSARWIGLTATPWRLDGSGFDKFFGELVLGPSVAWLIEQGQASGGKTGLSDYEAYSIAAPDMAGIHTRAGDYVKAEIAELMDRRALIGDMVSHYKALAGGRRAVYFAVGIAHSQNIAASFRDAGIPAEHLDASHSTVERIAAAVRFASGETQVLTNVDLFGEGYDLAAQARMPVTIDCVGLARPTQSLGLHLQQIGRSLRPKSDGSKALILDHAGNLLRHGLPDQEREWSLAPREKTRGGKGAPKAPIRECASCLGAFPVGLDHCPYCGTVVETTSREAEQVDGSLEKLDVEAARQAARKEQGEARSIAALIALAQSRGYAKPEKWAAHIYTARQTKRQAKRDTPLDKSYEEMKLW